MVVTARGALKEGKDDNMDDGRALDDPGPIQSQEGSSMSGSSTEDTTEQFNSTGDGQGGRESTTVNHLSRPRPTTGTRVQ